MARRASVETLEKDSHLMKLVAAGDERAVAELYDRFSSLVFKIALAAFKNKSAAEDVVQDTFVILWKNANRYDSTRASLATFVALIARRKVIDQLRRNKTHLPEGYQFKDRLDTKAIERETESDPDSRLEQEATRRTVSKALNGLRPLQKGIIERSHYNGLTLREISEEAQIPLGTIKSALSRGYNRLKGQARLRELTYTR